MPITLPKLDDRSYASLIEEARALIPSLYPAWTDHNPTDTGITLIELFAWLTEMLIYRADQVPDRHRLTFLKLLNGPDASLSLVADATIDADSRAQLLAMLYGTPPAPATPQLVELAIRLTVIGLRRRDRAITASDFAALALAAAPEVARAACVPRRDLAASDEPGRQAVRPGYVSVVLVPHTYALTAAVVSRLRSAGLPEALLSTLATIDNSEVVGAAAFSTLLRGALDEAAFLTHSDTIMQQALVAAPQPGDALRETVRLVLDDKRTLTTRLRVVGPFYAPVDAQIVIIRRADSRDETVRQAVLASIDDWLHAQRGGPDGRGWPFGRDVYLSDLYARLEAVPGVDYLPDLLLRSVCEPAAPRCVPASELWNDDGDQLGLALSEHLLPRSRVAPGSLIIAPAAVPLRLTVRARLAPDTDPVAARRAIKTAVRASFSPFVNGPNASDDWKVWAFVPGPLSPADRQALLEVVSRLGLVTGADLKGRIEAAATGVSVQAQTLQTDPAWQLYDGLGRPIGAIARARELADIQLQLTLE